MFDAVKIPIYFLLKKREKKEWDKIWKDKTSDFIVDFAFIDHLMCWFFDGTVVSASL